MTDRELFRQALEALESNKANWQEKTAAITALRERLAQPEQEPVAWGYLYFGDIIDCITPEEHARAEGKYTVPLYTAPQPAQQPLTDEQIKVIAATPAAIPGSYVHAYARAIEGAHGITATREHVTDDSPCWCNPEATYTDPDTGASVIVHKEPQ